MRYLALGTIVIGFVVLYCVVGIIVAHAIVTIWNSL